MEPTFRISRRELLEKLEFLVPFCREKKYHLYDVTDLSPREIYDDEIEIDASCFTVPYFGDKIVVKINLSDVILSVFIDGMLIQANCPLINNDTAWDDVRFCFDAKKLLSVIKSIEAEELVFDSMLFYGFRILDAKTGDQLSVVKCCSDYELEDSYKYKKYGKPKECFFADRKFLISSLTKLEKYCTKNDYKYYWTGNMIFSLNEGHISAYGSNGRILSAMREKCEQGYDFKFFIPAKFADAVCSKMKNITDDPLVLIYDDSVVICDSVRCHDNNYKIIIPQKVKLPNVDTISDGEVSISAKISKSWLTKMIRICRGVECYSYDYIAFNFVGKHCICHYKGDYFSITEFSPAIDVYMEGIVCANIYELSRLLEDVDSDVVCVTKKKNKIFLLSEDEYASGNGFRLLFEKDYDADYIKKRESEIESLPKYIELLEKEKNMSFWSRNVNC